MTPDHVNPIQWTHAMGVARQACARIFRDGGTPADALAQFGVTEAARQGAQAGADWSRTVETIAQSLCAVPVRRAA